MPSIAEQDATQLGGRWSVLVRQKRDHEHLDRLLEHLPGATGDRRDVLLQDVYRLVFPHAFAEESVLWPAVRRALPEGEALTLRVEEEHQEVNEIVTGLQDPDLPEHDRGRRIERLVRLLREDVRDEEDELLPRLQQELTTRQLRALGLAWEAVRRTAPTRPHPVVSRRPPGNVLAALPLTVLDRARDRLDAGARRGSGARRARLRSVSAQLGRAGGRVERLPLMRSGETERTRRSR